MFRHMEYKHAHADSRYTPSQFLAHWAPETILGIQM